MHQSSCWRSVPRAGLLLVALFSACRQSPPTTAPTADAIAVPGTATTDPGFDPDSWVPPPGVDRPPTTAPPGDTPTLTWKQRMAIDIDSFKRDDALRYMRVRTAIPDEEDPNDPEFIALLSGDPRSAGVILQRLMSASEPLELRTTLVQQLPYTRGDWQEAGAVLIRIDPDWQVRKALVETMRYAEAPHAAIGLRSGLEDETPAVRAAAARTAAFQPSATLIEAELLTALSDDPDWETRAAVAHSLGILELRSAFPGLVTALADGDLRVRLAALLSLERLDTAAAATLDEVKRLSRGGGDAQITAAARRIIKSAAASSAPSAPE